jgi:hypothetical protein
MSAWLANHSLAVQALAAAASVLLTAVLVVTTIFYARTTKKILEESQKARLAAQKQASAAEQQASAAFRSVELLQEQIMEQLGLGHSIVQTAIESAISAITYWKAQDLRGLAHARGLAPTDSLVPANALAAVDHARRIDQQAAQLVSSAFDDLRNARNEVESMKEAAQTTAQAGSFFDFTRASRQAERWLDTAFEKLQKAQATLLVARPKPY